MSFSYQFGANPPIDWPRLLIADTADAGHIFEDAEITMATAIQASTTQSGQFYSPPLYATLPSTPVSFYRVAAILLDALASNKARLSGAVQILDVKMDLEKAAAALHSQAEAYREVDDNSGCFALIEQVNDVFSFRDRFWKQVQRQAA